MEKNDVNETKIDPTNPMEAELTMKTVETSTPADTKQGVIDLPLTDIQRDEKFLVRLERNEQTVEDYAELFKDYKEGKIKYPFPPITIWYDASGRCILLAGDHRTAAGSMAGLTTIKARVFQGSEREAYMLAYKDNATNALPLSRGDKKYAITKALRLFPDKSLEFFVQELKCSKSYASELRKELYDTGQLIRPEEVIGEDGKTYRCGKEQPSEDTLKEVPQVKGLLEESVSDAGLELMQAVLDFTVDDVALSPPIEEIKVPEKSPEERIDEFMASLDAFVGTLQYSGWRTLCRTLVDWLRRRAPGKKMLKYNVSKHDFPVKPPAAERTTIDAVKAEGIMPSQQTILTS